MPDQYLGRENEAAPGRPQTHRKLRVFHKPGGAGPNLRGKATDGERRLALDNHVCPSKVVFPLEHVIAKIPLAHEGCKFRSHPRRPTSLAVEQHTPLSSIGWMLCEHFANAPDVIRGADNIIIRQCQNFAPRDLHARIQGVALPRLFFQKELKSIRMPLLKLLTNRPSYARICWTVYDHKFPVRFLQVCRRKDGFQSLREAFCPVPGTNQNANHRAAFLCLCFEEYRDLFLGIAGFG